MKRLEQSAEIIGAVLGAFAGRKIAHNRAAHVGEKPSSLSVIAFSLGVGILAGLAAGAIFIEEY